MTNQASEVKRSSLNKSDVDVKLESIIRSCIDDPHDRTIGEAKEAILDWHNKQIEAVLDRVKSSAKGAESGISAHIMIEEAIEAERNKLKESK